MDSRHSEAPPRDAPDVLTQLRNAIRGGDWGAAQSIALGLARCALPPETRELGAYLDALRQTLLLARASRANSAASLARVRAAARFQTHRSFIAGDDCDRQDFAAPAGIGRDSLSSVPISSDT
jgi:hypothetical protein